MLTDMFRPIQHIHFVGIGGIGMSGIAEVLVESRLPRVGSDQKKSEVTARLEEMGVRNNGRSRGRKCWRRARGGAFNRRA